MRARTWLVAGGLVAALVTTGWVALLRTVLDTTHGTRVDPPVPIGDFALTAHTGEAVRLADFRGRLVLVSFGYTSCPDVCPATLSEVARALAALGPAADEVQVLFVSVDPERDTREVLGSWVGAFGPRVLGLFGSEEEIGAVEQLFGTYHVVRSDEAGVRLVDHSTRLWVLDRAGALVLSFPFGFAAQELTADLRRLLD